MLRSPTQRSRSITELIRDNPFLCVAFLSGLSLAALEADVGSQGMFEWLWQVLGIGFKLTADWPQKLMPGMTGWLSIAMNIVLGLIPYLLADIVWRHLRNR
ncbi:MULTISPECIES: hypothetical protein [unclassified Wenzhouxiangella]|uniref:hypothetical protein n=1 Tax=unclassified Wenzhouxiangella TaxID=2613841 RepID=UPI0015F27C24|nr:MULTISPECIES: hypothetical protein [unclassified Wenzhouxiangella]